MGPAGLCACSGRAGHGHLTPIEYRKNIINVDSSYGSDKKGQREGYAFKTFMKALSAAKPGDTVYLRAGEYDSLQLKPQVNIIGKGKVIVHDLTAPNHSTEINASVEGITFASRKGPFVIRGYGGLKFKRCDFETNTVYRPGGVLGVVIGDSSVDFENCTFYAQATTQHENVRSFYVVGGQSKVLIFNSQIVIQGSRYNNLGILELATSSPNRSVCYFSGNEININDLGQSRITMVNGVNSNALVTFNDNGIHVNSPEAGEFNLATSVGGQNDTLIVSGNKISFLHPSKWVGHVNIGSADNDSTSVIANGNTFNINDHVRGHHSGKGRVHHTSYTNHGLCGNIGSNSIRVVSQNTTLDHSDSNVCIITSNPVTLTLPKLNGPSTMDDRVESHCIEIKPLHRTQHKIVPANGDTIDMNKSYITMNGNTVKLRSWGNTWLNF